MCGVARAANQRTGGGRRRGYRRTLPHLRCPDDAAVGSGARLPGGAASHVWRMHSQLPLVTVPSEPASKVLPMQTGVVWCVVVWCGVVWCGVVWCGVVWCGVVWCGVVWCGVVWCGVVWCGVVWCGVVWCGVLWCGVVWCGVVWCGVVWCGVVWCGVVWCGVVWCGVPKALLPKGKRPGCLPTGTGKRAGLCVLCARCA